MPKVKLFHTHPHTGEPKLIRHYINQPDDAPETYPWLEKMEKLAEELRQRNAAKKEKERLRDEKRNK